MIISKKYSIYNQNRKRYFSLFFLSTKDDFENLKKNATNKFFISFAKVSIGKNPLHTLNFSENIKSSQSFYQIGRRVFT